MRILFFLFTGLALAVGVGEMVELTEYLNGRSSNRFAKNSNNLLKVLPPGTKGKVEEVREFSKSGNAGIKIEVSEGPDAGKEFWVYFNRKITPPRIKLFTPDGAATAEPARAAAAETAAAVSAVAEPQAVVAAAGESAEAAASAPAAPAEPAAQAQPGAPVQTSTQVAPEDIGEVLYVGDSHTVGCLGDRLDEKLRSIADPATPAKKVRVNTLGLCGTSPAHWLETRGKSSGTVCPGYRKCEERSYGTCAVGNQLRPGSLENILEAGTFKTAKRKTVVIELGTNMIVDDLEETMEDVRQMIIKVKSKNAQCVWIGPPQPTARRMEPGKFDRYNARLKREVEAGDCTFISSNAPITDRANIIDPEGLHYTCSQSAAWASKISGTLLQTVQRQLTPLTNSGQNSSAEPRANGRSN